MRSLKVSLLELPLYANTLPLAAGYLQAYAQQDPDVARSCHFTIHAPEVRTSVDDLVALMLAAEADVYAMSCYLWNMRRMKEVLDELVRLRPDAHFILGGPQVMNYTAEYVPPSWENVVVCNGEGEQPFTAYLRELAGADPDFSRVPGVSFWSDGELVTTDKPTRIKELDEIPSPFAAGIFDGGEYVFAVVETNRGCPFRCSYCYWGAATNDKVHRWELDRVKADLTWISEHGIESIFVADANWGALPRDVELTRHLVECKERYGYPMMVTIQAAKNRPDRVTEITEILVEGGMLTSQPVSLQTLSPQALDLVQRANIKESTYVELQLQLREKKISSYTELIWPLPGETLQSFQEGIAKLCATGADAVVAYPQLLLRNTPMYERRESLGIVTVRVDDPVAEADVVVATNWVTQEEFQAGAWFYYAVISLYNARAGFYVARQLDRSGVCSYVDFLCRAADYYKTRTDTDICRFFADSVSSLGNYDINNIGKVLHYVLQSHRGEMDRLLEDFLAEQGWLADPRVRMAFELDLLARPYVYREAVTEPTVPLRHLRVVSRGRYEFEIELPAAAAELLTSFEPIEGLLDVDPVRLRVDHGGRHKMPYPRRRSLDHNAAYCQVMMNRLRDILPTWAPVVPDVTVAGALDAP
ncbi:cobalamin-dependent protein [Planotetraspora sp. A-T 1434]|uniref:B12-binding domain-containing radical SAM protein n=1 Tax=Planotetraspora sp. A-T 1434 TaxID=2979219 RepID=UPI0021BE0748|nr:radical SAM protein [Planotetraspora sp. A-T 1434]MCT9933197.1 cobalamin-dependent protein [Planotetraspora sp. A-T 1434]